MLNLRNAVLWQTFIVLLHTCCTSAKPSMADDPSIPQSFIFTLNGRRVTLSEIYNVAELPASTRRISDEIESSLFPYEKLIISHKPWINKNDLAGEVYTKRKLIRPKLREPGHTEVTGSRIDHAKPGPSSESIWTEIAENAETGSSAENTRIDVDDISQEIMSKPPNDKSITFISGESLSGKTTTLKTIQCDIAGNPSNYWIIYVDIVSLLLAMPANTQVTTSDIKQHYIAPKFHDLFEDLLSVKPHKIVIFFDSIDKIEESAGRAADAIKDFANRGARVVVSGYLRTRLDYQDKGMTLKVFEIPEMDFLETKQYLRNIWWLNALSTAGKKSQLELHWASQRLDEYMTAFTLFLCDTPIPRTALTLQLVAIDLDEPEINIPVMDYLINKDIPPPLALLRHGTINKNDLYNEIRIMIMRAYGLDLDENFPLVLGLVALDNIVKRTKSLDKTMLGPFEEDIELCHEILKDNYDYAIHFVTEINNQFRFIHPEFERYFAAEYLVNLMVPGGPGRQVLQAAFSNKDAIRVLEFVNNNKAITGLVAAYDGQPMRRLLGSVLDSQSLDPSIMNHLLRHGFEGLVQRVVEELRVRDKLHVFIKYLDRELKEGKLMNIEIEQSFGMLVSKERPWLDLQQQQLTARQMMARHNFRTTLSTLRHDDPQIRMQISTLLRSAVIKIDADPLFVKSLCVWTGHKISSEVAMELISTAIESGGESSMEVVEYLSSFVENPTVQEVKGIYKNALDKGSLNLLVAVAKALPGPVYLDMEILAKIFDTSPSALYTPMNWWENVHSFLRSQLPSTLNQLKYIRWTDEADLNIPEKDYKSVYVKIMLGVREIDLDSRTSRSITELQIKPLTYDDPVMQKYGAIARIVPAPAWKLQSSTLGLRRRALTSQLGHQARGGKVSLLDFLENYPGVASLSPRDHFYYRKTIELLRESHANRRTSMGVNRKGPSEAALYDVGYIDAYDLGKEQQIQGLRNTEMSARQRLTQSIRYQDDSSKAPVPSTSSLITCITSKRKRRSIASNACIDRPWIPTDVMTRGDRPIINSDKYVEYLSKLDIEDAPRLKLVMKYTRQQIAKYGTGIVTGESKMLVQTNEYEHFIYFRQYQRMTDVSIDFPNRSPVSKIHLPSRLILSYSLTMLPIIKRLTVTTTTCMAAPGTPDCIFAGSTLGVAATLPIVGAVTVKYSPWMVRSFSRTALGMMPARTPLFMKTNLQMVGRLSGATAAKMVGVGFMGLGIGLDVANIAVASSKLANCADDSCTSRDRGENIILITFSCASLVITAGLMATGPGVLLGPAIAVGLMVLESIALGINEVVYYRNYYDTNFDETMRIFFHKAVGLSTPQDVVKLTDRTHQVKYFQNVAENFFKSYPDAMAYGVVYGTLTSDQKILPSYGKIDMAHKDHKNTLGRSRILPSEEKNYIQLCLPQARDVYISEYLDTNAEGYPDAVYGCENAMVIARGDQWNKRRADPNNFIWYSLSFVNDGSIIGSNEANNRFIIGDSKPTLDIVGGNGSTINIYVPMSNAFRGNILLTNTHMGQNLVNLSQITAGTMKFEWNNTLEEGRIKIDGEEFYVVPKNRDQKSLIVIGRAGMRDEVSCNWSSDRGLLNSVSPMIFDLRGSNSLSNADLIKDCKNTTLYPYTVIEGSNSPGMNVTYQTFIPLVGPMGRERKRTKARIHPLQSNFLLIFANRSLLSSTIQVNYSWNTKRLVWMVEYDLGTSMEITIDPFVADRDRSNCMMMDQYGNTVAPIIELPKSFDGGQDTVEVKHFNVYARVNSSHFEDVNARYKNISGSYKNLFPVTRLMHSEANNTFLFGSSGPDRFYVDETTIYLAGYNGRDIYSWREESPRAIWIDNVATDDETDILQIPDEMCDFIFGKTERRTSDLFDSSTEDLTLFCTHMQKKLPNFVILRNWQSHLQYRHLQIWWRNLKRVLVPVGTVKYGDELEVHSNVTHELIPFFSLDQETTALTVASSDRALIINGSMRIVAYRANDDMILAREFVHEGSSSFVVLKRFFNKNNSTDEDWQAFRIFTTINYSKNDHISASYSADDLWRLCNQTFGCSDTQEDEFASVLFDKYSYNFNTMGKPEYIIHNYEKRNDELRLGILTLIGLKPEELHVGRNILGISSTKIRSSAAFYKNNTTGIDFAIWCEDRRYRLYRIELIRDFGYEPIVIDVPDHLDCFSKENNVFDVLNKKIHDVQLLYDSMEKISHDYRLMQCIGIAFADLLSADSAYRFFRFTSYQSQMWFSYHYCDHLLSEKNLEGVSYERFKEFLDNTMKKFNLDVRITQEERDLIKPLYKKIQEFNDVNLCWNYFKYSLWHRHKSARISRIDNDILISSTTNLTKCIK